jgi:hypothetical protein
MYFAILAESVQKKAGNNDTCVAISVQIHADVRMLAIRNHSWRSQYIYFCDNDG